MQQPQARGLKLFDQLDHLTNITQQFTQQRLPLLRQLKIAS